jgi:topoisomerase-4 subunit A
VSQLMKYMKGPDFPTGGIIQGLDGIKKAYESGKGKIVVRSKVDEEELRNGFMYFINWLTVISGLSIYFKVA